MSPFRVSLCSLALIGALAAPALRCRARRRRWWLARRRWWLPRWRWWLPRWWRLLRWWIPPWLRIPSWLRIPRWFLRPSRIRRAGRLPGILSISLSLSGLLPAPPATIARGLLRAAGRLLPTSAGLQRAAGELPVVCATAARSVACDQFAADVSVPRLFGVARLNGMGGDSRTWTAVFRLLLSQSLSALHWRFVVESHQL